MTDIYRKLAALSPERRALFEKRLAAQGLAQVPQAIPARAPGTAPLPLSFAQRRLWFVQQLDPGNTAYNMMTVLRFRGDLDRAAMVRAVEGVLARHEALRTRYAPGPDGEPQQVVEARSPLTLHETDLSAEADPLEAARRHVAGVTAQPYDLAEVPVRAGLFRLGAQDHVLAIGLHHIAGDRWSMGLIVQELAQLYAAARTGAEPALPPLAVHQPDLALWQRAAAGTAPEAQLAYWRDRLEGDLPTLELPFDRPRGAAPGVKGGFLPFELTPEVAEAARAMARARGVSLFTLLLAGFKVLLLRYCDSDDIIVGCEAANRDRAETQGMVGPLVNTLVMRSDLSATPGFAEVLTRVEATVRAALAHQDVPFEQVVEAVKPARRLNEMMPLFQAKFDLQQANALPPTIGGLRLERFPYEERAAKYELRFNLEDHGHRIAGRVEYCADLFDAATIARMADHFQRLLAGMLADPVAPVAALPMLSEAERADILGLADGPPLPAHADTLTAALEAQVDRTPDAVALTHAGRDISYAVLDAQANAVAAALIARGIAPETRVGVCIRRSPAMLAAILGVLKAGAAYVPLDPAYPAARIAYIAGDAGAGIVLTDGGLLPFESARPLELLDVTALPPAPRPAPRGMGDALAVVIYTSGSTGQPKGVALEHRNILSRMAWGGEAFGADDLAGVLFATSICFDLSIFEIFVTLGHGGRLVLVDTLLDLPRLPDTAGVTLLNTVPSLLRELVRHDDLPPSVRTINLAGEFFPPVLLDRLLDFPTLKVINNLYGPTEDTIYGAGNPVQDEPERPMPIGRPLPGSRCYVLDRNGQLLPRGVAGEICVAGAGLARGYFGQPDLTAERFLPDPHDPRPGTRLYRSGDRGRWRADGRLDIHGRIDTQVKIRGLRIETEEIQNVLETHPDVAEAFVIATGTSGAVDRQLAAYLSPPAGRTARVEDLRAYLAARLPAHMVPALWQVTDGLPRMPNGKVDRKLLVTLTGGAREHIAPRTAVEARIVALWAEVLGGATVGIDDDFFERGGHSLLAMRLVMRLQQEFRVDISIAELFPALTPRAQALLVEQAMARAAAAKAAPLPADDAITAHLSDAEVDALLLQMTAEQVN